MNFKKITRFPCIPVSHHTCFVEHFIFLTFGPLISLFNVNGMVSIKSGYGEGEVHFILSFMKRSRMIKNGTPLHSRCKYHGYVCVHSKIWCCCCCFSSKVIKKNELCSRNQTSWGFPIRADDSQFHNDNNNSCSPSNCFRLNKQYKNNTDKCTTFIPMTFIPNVWPTMLFSILV